MLLASLGPIAISKVLRQPQSSLGLNASAKELHEPLSFLDTVSLDNDPSQYIWTNPSPKCGAAFTLTKATSTTTCSVFSLSVARTAVPAVHDQKREGVALDKASSPSAYILRIWRHPKHRASIQQSQDRQRCASSRPESSQPRWLLCYFVRLSRIFRWCFFRLLLTSQHRFLLSPRPTWARLKRAIIFTSIRATLIPATSSSDTSGSATSIYNTSTSEILAPSIPNNTPIPVDSYSSSQSSELQQVLTALSIETFLIPENLRKKLIEPHLRLNILSVALNELRIPIASVTALISSAAPPTVPESSSMQSVCSRIPISSEQANPLRMHLPRFASGDCDCLAHG